MSAAERKKRTRTALERVQMVHRSRHTRASSPADSSSASPSRGRSPVSPAIVLADEPTGSLDSANGDAVIDLLGELHREGATICIVTHESRYAALRDRTVHLFDGRCRRMRSGG